MAPDNCIATVSTQPVVAVKYGESGVSPESLFPFVTSLKGVFEEVPS